jgi:hypothetical protein
MNNSALPQAKNVGRPFRWLKRQGQKGEEKFSLVFL